MQKEPQLEPPMLKTFLLCALATIALIVVGGAWLFWSAMEAHPGGDEIVNSYFQPLPGQYFSDVNGESSYVFREGLLFEWARFRSPEQPSFRDFEKWHKVTNGKELTNHVQQLRAQFTKDNDVYTSLQDDVSNIEVYVRGDDNAPLRYAYNKRTHLGALAYGSTPQTYGTVIKQLDELKKRAETH